MLLQKVLFCSFLWLSSIPLYIWTTSFLSILPIDGHLDCFHVLAIMNSVAMKIRVRIYFSARVLSESPVIFKKLIKKIF